MIRSFLPSSKLLSIRHTTWLPMSSLLYSQYEALKHIQGQHKLNLLHAKLFVYLKPFHIVINTSWEDLAKVQMLSQEDTSFCSYLVPVCLDLSN